MFCITIQIEQTKSLDLAFKEKIPDLRLPQPKSQLHLSLIKKLLSFDCKLTRGYLSWNLFVLSPISVHLSLITFFVSWSDNLVGGYGYDGCYDLLESTQVDGCKKKTRNKYLFKFVKLISLWFMGILWTSIGKGNTGRLVGKNKENRNVYDDWDM